MSEKSEDPTLLGQPRARADDPTRIGAPAPPTVEFEQFEVRERLGSGAMGDVYLAFDKRRGEEVALKVLHSAAFKLADAQDVINRFLREAQATARLDHPGIVRVHEAGELRGTHYIAMQFIRGKTLGQQLDKRPMTDPRRIAELMLDLARAIGHAHDNGILHRDLKPSNILLDLEGKPYVADFGLAHVTDQTRLTLSGQSLGTPSYMSPEQAQGDARHVSEATDVYGLGAILYELLTGRPPIQRENLYSTVYAVIHEPPEPPDRINPAADVLLQRICLKCLEKAPEARYPTTAPLVADLERYLEGKRVKARRKLPPLAPLFRQLAALLLLLGIAGSGAWLIWRASRKQPGKTEAAPAVPAPAAAELGLPGLVLERGAERVHRFPRFDRVAAEDPKLLVASAQEDGLSVSLVGVKPGRTRLVLERTQDGKLTRWTAGVQIVLPLADSICSEVRASHAGAAPDALAARAARHLEQARQASDYPAYLEARRAWCLLEKLSSKPPAFYEAYKLFDGIASQLDRQFAEQSARVEALAAEGRWGPVDLRLEELARRFPDPRDWRHLRAAALRAHYLVGEQPVIPIQDAVLYVAAGQMHAGSFEAARPLIRAAAGFEPAPPGIDRLLQGKLEGLDAPLYRRTGLVELGRGVSPAGPEFKRAMHRWASGEPEQAAELLARVEQITADPESWRGLLLRRMRRAGVAAVEATMEEARQLWDDQPAAAAARLHAARMLHPTHQQARALAYNLAGKTLIGINVDRQLYRDKELPAPEFRKKLAAWRTILGRLDPDNALLPGIDKELAGLR